LTDGIRRNKIILRIEIVNIYIENPAFENRSEIGACCFATGSELSEIVFYSCCTSLKETNYDG
jgi:hypothetical protein